MFLKNYPAMKINEYLVVSDLHVGITKDIYDSGILLPLQSDIMADRLNYLKKITHTKKLIILGDVKHKVPGFSMHEKFEIEKFLKMLAFKEIILIKGNHDGNIEHMIPYGMIGRVSIKKSASIEKYFLTHGHRNVSTKKKVIIIGHNQPHIMLRDDIGAYYTEPVWLRGKLTGKLDGKTLIVMPAFNEFCGATIVNREKMLGPIANLLDKSRTNVYMIDGTDIGKLSNLRVK